MDNYTPEEFAECFSLRGYGRKKDALAWLGDRSEATEEDFEKCWRDVTRSNGRKPVRAMTTDGQNRCSPSNMGNSRGKSFNAEMAYKQAINDALEQRYRERMHKKILSAESGESGSTLSGHKESAPKEEA